MTLRIQHVDPAYINQMWAQVEPFITEALNKSCGDNLDYTAEHVRVYVTQGQWLLLVAADEENKIHGAATINFINFPLHRVAFITAIGGKLITNDDTFAQLTAILKHRGATKIQGAVRPAVARLCKQYKLEERNILVEALL